MNNETYDGMTNYATWLVYGDFFKGLHEDYEEWDDKDCRYYVEDSLNDQSELDAKSYAYAFISNVNWLEIAERVNTKLDNKDRV